MVNESPSGSMRRSGFTGRLLGARLMLPPRAWKFDGNRGTLDLSENLIQTTQTYKT